MALVYQKLTLEVTPGATPPVLHVTEYDINMQIDVTFTQRGQPYEIPSGTTANVEGTLARHPFRVNCDVNGNTVTFILTKSMTAYAGRAWTKIVLTNNTWPVSTCGFWLDVDLAGVEAETVINSSGFEEQLQTAFTEYLEKHGTAPVGSGVSSVNGKSGVAVLKTSDLENDSGFLGESDADRLNYHNLLLDYPASEYTNGIAFTQTGDGGVRVSGTAAGDSFYNFYHNMSAIPSNLHIGKTYRAHYDGSSNVKFHFWFYKDGKYFSGYTITGDRNDLVIPDGINGMVIRLSVDSGLTVNEVVHPRIMSSITNEEMISRSALYPSLTAKQKRDILSLISEYKSVKSRIYYDYDSTILSFLDAADTYTSGNKIRLCCDTFAELIWGGVSASTFPDASTSYTGNIVKAFDWGYFSPHMIRQRTVGLASRDSSGNIIEFYGFRTIGNTVNKSYSYNTRYTSGGTLLNSQKWLGGLGANDLANELYLGGYEVPPSKADVGDLVFYTATPYASASDEFPQFNSAFRQIFHVAIITARINGFFEVAEITSENNGASPLVTRSIFSEDDFLCARSGFMQRYAVMFARHPAAFGIVGNVPEKFQNIPTRL